MSWSQRIWQLKRIVPSKPRASSTLFSAAVIWPGSPAMNSTRQVVQRALSYGVELIDLGLVFESQYQPLAVRNVERPDSVHREARACLLSRKVERHEFSLTGQTVAGNECAAIGYWPASKASSYAGNGQRWATLGIGQSREVKEARWQVR